MTEISNGISAHNYISRLWLSFNREKHIAPLAVFRVAFGVIMLISTVRFIAKGWVYDFYISPKCYFPFYGFEWVRPLPAAGMYSLFAIMVIASIFIAIGFLYKLSISAFFICFVYTELIDKTYYLNHYYVVSIVSFLLLLVPAHRYFSVDVVRNPSLKVTHVPGWTINIFKWQLCVIYFCAGISKLNYDWMCQALPLKIWLPANAGLTLIGPLLTQAWVAFLFSWFAAAFDISIGFLLLSRAARPWAYLLVVIFHMLTAWLFKIGMFPYVMIFITIIFFSESFHLRVIKNISNLWPHNVHQSGESKAVLTFSLNKKKLLYSLLGLYAVLQVLVPFRFLLYPGTLFWTEEGYRFSWRVMLMEKSGTAFFYIKDPATGNSGEVPNGLYLTPLQERMMATQPDMIVQYAHYLHHVYRNKGIKDPIVTAECYVTLNGSGSRLFIDPTTDLSKQTDNFLPKKWILPFHNKQQ